MHGKTLYYVMYNCIFMEPREYKRTIYDYTVFIKVTYKIKD